MNKIILQKRTKQFNINVIKACENLPRNAAGFELAKQIIRSSGSVGVNYRATQRAKSKADFIYKLEIVTEEADETMYWLEVMNETKLIDAKIASTLIKEANELVSIFVATVKQLKQIIQLKNHKQINN
jgi:four helix bundle protein